MSTARRDASPPAKIGRFTIEREQASGGSGTVYVGRDPETGERVAVKVIRGLAEENLARFQREAGTLAGLRHPGIVRYVDHGKTPGGAGFIAMEWLDGEDLRARIARQPLGAHEAITLGVRIADALSAVHVKGLVHRDLKPGNVFLPGGRIADAKLVDFGLVRTAGRLDDELTSTGLVVGTPAYMSPEQARGSREIDPRSDLFALGNILYRCLTGRLAFDGKTSVGVLAKILLESPVPVTELRPDVPAPLADLVMRLLEKDPEHRPQSAAHLHRMLAALALSCSHVPESVREPGGDAGKTCGTAAVTGEEMRYQTLLMVAAPRADIAARVRSLTRAQGGHAEELYDGTLVITLDRDGLIVDQAARAGALALALRAELPELSMAIAAGRAGVGHRQPIGEALDRAAQLLGESIEESAQRELQGEAEQAGAIIVDDVTAALLDARFEIAAGPGSRRLVRARLEVAPSRAVRGRIAPMLGRDWELRSIETFFEQCVDEPTARAVLVTGAAGMGKSRLAHEATLQLSRRHLDLQVWRADGESMRSGSALDLLGQLVRSASGVHEDDSLDARREQLLQVARRLWPAEATEMACFLGELTRTPFPDGASMSLEAARHSPRIMSDRVAVIFESLVQATCARGALLVVLNDAQWADVATMRLVGDTLGKLSDLPWLVLVLARPEIHQAFPGLWNERGLTELKLRPLPRRTAMELCRTVLGDTVGRETMEKLVARADGNAFYLEELIRSVAEDASRGARSVPLPDTVLGMVQARIASLEPGERRALRAASVLGETFWLGSVSALLAGALPTEVMDSLVERDIFVPRAQSRFSGERELGFRHALLREGAYGMLTDEDRRRGHALAGEWLIARREPDAMVIGRHFELAGQPERAAEFFLKAAQDALAAADVTAAIELGERALPHIATEAKRVDCLVLLMEGHLWQTSWAHTDEYARQVMALSRPGSAAWLGATGARLFNAMMFGRVDALLESLAGVASAEPERGAEVVGLRAIGLATLVLLVSGQLQAAAHMGARARAVRDRKPESPVVCGWDELIRAWTSLWVDARPFSCRRHALAARASFDSVHDARHARIAAVFGAVALWCLGDLEGAEREIRAQDSVGDSLVRWMQGRQLVAILIDAARTPEARAEVRAMLEQRLAETSRDGKAGSTFREAETRAMLGEVAYLEGDLDAAADYLSTRLEPLRAWPIAWAIASVRLAYVRRDQGRPAEALDLAKRARNLLRRLGARSFRDAIILLALAEMYEATGQRDLAIVALKEGLEHVEHGAADMDSAARRGFFTGRPENVRLFELAREWGVPPPAVD